MLMIVNFHQPSNLSLKNHRLDSLSRVVIRHHLLETTYKPSKNKELTILKDAKGIRNSID